MRRSEGWIDAMLIAMLLVTGCTHSLREQAIKAQLPQSYKEHKSGLTIPPTEVDVQEALALGAAAKDSFLVEYAHIYKPTLRTYVRVKTPVYLIADHARDCAREYKEPDPDFVAYCRVLDVAHITLEEVRQVQYFYLYSLPYNVILLRDGKRVEPLTSVPAWKGTNPFIRLDKDVDQILRRSLSQAQAVLQQYSWLGQRSKVSALSVSDLDGFFRASELKKPGKYEIVFRTRETSNMLAPGDEEYRYQIKFEAIK